MCFFNFIFVMLMEPFIYVNICMVHNLINVRHGGVSVLECASNFYFQKGIYFSYLPVIFLFKGFIIVSSPRYWLMEEMRI